MTDTPTDVTGLAGRLENALDHAYVTLEEFDAQAVTAAVLAVLEGEVDAAWGDWAEHGSRLRTCCVPGCLRQFDLVGSWTSEGKKAVPDNLRSEGWLQSRTVGYVCPDHAPALWGSGDGPHTPNWQRDESRRGGAVLRCSCGWEAGDTRFRGHGTVLWQVHALEVLEPQQ